MARIAGRVSRSFDLRAIIDEITECVALELDFAREADTTERIRAAMCDDLTVRVPRVHRQYTTGKLLVLEYLEGTKRAEKDAVARGTEAEPTACDHRRSAQSADAGATKSVTRSSRRRAAGEWRT